MNTYLSPAKFLSGTDSDLIIDVRSPLEYKRGHIPGALSLPLFSDEERAIVGTLYTKEGSEVAFNKALSLVGPKLSCLLSEINNLSPARTVSLYCWRGGMRSASMAWLLNMGGYQTSTLEKGYKAYRKYVLESFGKIYRIMVLGGNTGSGKTQILKNLSLKGEQVLDIENLANHKGSVFGGLGQDEQNTGEHFENLLSSQLQKFDSQKRIWIEDESQQIGRNYIPDAFWKQMLGAPLVYIQLPKDIRTDRIVEEYGNFDSTLLQSVAIKLERRIGGQQSKEIQSLLADHKFKEATEILLEYYDKTYHHSLSKRTGEIIELHFSSFDEENITTRLLNI